ncbi:hypothetical protein RND71_034141 [Anisodus tanguticus]|uniref:Uncharacterized protein n=1 Tax=Anisodus tanguticus TaxID=243964 RepID=A0AAE1RBJ8_9SOLA|nr:hypothetical protein RND71_034141 [Anisodus tanguticus]
MCRDLNRGSALLQLLLLRGSSHIRLSCFAPPLLELKWETTESVGCASEMVKRDVVGLDNFRFFDGYCAWEKDQLRDEIKAGYWTSSDCDPNVIGLSMWEVLGFGKKFLGLWALRKSASLTRSASGVVGSTFSAFVADAPGTLAASTLSNGRLPGLASDNEVKNFSMRSIMALFDAKTASRASSQGGTVLRVVLPCSLRNDFECLPRLKAKGEDKDRIAELPSPMLTPHLLFDCANIFGDGQEHKRFTLSNFEDFEKERREFVRQVDEFMQQMQERVDTNIKISFMTLTTFENDGFTTKMSHLYAPQLKEMFLMDPRNPLPLAHLSGLLKLEILRLHMDFYQVQKMPRNLTSLTSLKQLDLFVLCSDDVFDLLWLLSFLSTSPLLQKLVLTVLSGIVEVRSSWLDTALIRKRFSSIAVPISVLLCQLPQFCPNEQLFHRQ